MLHNVIFPLYFIVFRGPCCYSLLENRNYIFDSSNADPSAKTTSDLKNAIMKGFLEITKRKQQKEKQDVPKTETKVSVG